MRRPFYMFSFVLSALHNCIIISGGKGRISGAAA